MSVQRFDTIVIGGSQAGLGMGYYLSKLRRPFVILEANARVGDAWRNRWDSLRLFTPARYDGLPGMRFPGAQHAAPTKDEMADYLEAYAVRFDLPLRTGMRVHGLAHRDGRFVVTAGGEELEAEHIVLATGAHHTPKIPAFAGSLDPGIVQIPATAYRSPSQLRDGGVLLVGAGNSGADIALDVVGSHPTWLSGRHVGHVPFRIDTFAARYLVRVVRFIGHHVLTWRSPVGKKVLPILASRGAPLVRVKPKDLIAAGVERVPRVAGVRDGLPMLEDGRVLDVANVIWCTGSLPDLSWADLPITGDDGRILHTRGVATGVAGVYFLGLDFQFSVTSETITGVKRDARYIARRIAARMPQIADAGRVASTAR